MAKGKVVITGSSGFVGSRLVALLDSQGFEVISLDTYKSHELPSHVKHFSADLNELAEHELGRILEGSTIVHLAAVSTSSACENDPNLAIDVNLKLTKKIVEVANSSNCKLIFASTEWVYPEALNDSELNEEIDLLLSPKLNLYSVTKIVGEWIVRKYSSDFKILRFGIIYGERKNAQSAVENIINVACGSDTVEIGNPKTARRFIHVQDICLGIMKCIEDYSDSPQGIYNLTGDRLVTLSEIVALSEKKLKKQLKVKLNNSVVSVRNPSPDLFKSIFGWRPTISIEDGVQKIVEWEIKKVEEN